MEKIKNIHHISAIVGHPQENLEFYRDVLGLKLIKQTVNFDDPGVYHLYFSNDDVEPGTVMTFFPWTNSRQGRVGSGQVGRIAFRIPKGSADAWLKHLESKNIKTEVTDLFLNKTIEFEDIHGLDIALVESDIEKDSDAILGFHGSVLLSANPEETRKTLVNELGLTEVKDDPEHYHFETIGDLKHHIIIPKETLGHGLWGVGTVHHIAWSTPTEEEQKEWQDYMMDNGYGVTEVKDRNYFKAIYLKEKGHIIFEIATEGPGFMVDEPYEELGKNLKLPPQYEEHREKLTANLPELK
ncbi:ring-cleaving dioxygenase [Staphylococcus canis]|uniref:Ring-cleaving dioxygenase n=1 Tax=Staphylococcus canis TaxID=2724942 RepID=A0ABS0TAF7_9STAP|nr:ring-cleaving dioxygenase [Staphylococcus canis]MBI5975735.1 ring-cleaving dioxygenase [Staphylococcus canis]